MSIERPTTATTAEHLLGGSTVHREVERAADAATIASAHALESMAASLARLTEHLTAQPTMTVETVLDDEPTLEVLEHRQATGALMEAIRYVTGQEPPERAMDEAAAYLLRAGLFIARRGGQS